MWRPISKIKSGTSNCPSMQTCLQTIWSTKGASMLQQCKKLQFWCQTMMSLQKTTRGIFNDSIMRLCLCVFFLPFVHWSKLTIWCPLLLPLILFTDMSRSITEEMQMMSMVDFSLYLISIGHMILYNILWSFLMAKMAGTATCPTLFSSISTIN